MLKTLDTQRAIETVRVFPMRVTMICLYTLTEELMYGCAVVQWCWKWRRGYLKSCGLWLCLLWTYLFICKRRIMTDFCQDNWRLCTSKCSVNCKALNEVQRIMNERLDKLPRGSRGGGASFWPEGVENGFLDEWFLVGLWGWQVFND